MSDYCYVKKNFEGLKKELRELCHKLSVPEVTLVCVTKSAMDEEVLALLESGASDIGENRPQMLKARGELLRSNGYSPRLHEIGNLQKNKVKMIIEDVALIHSLDSYSLALEIDKQAGRVSRRVPVLVEINSAAEEAKGGVLPSEADAFIDSIRELPNLCVRGLMTMGPVCENPEDIRPYFADTKKLFDRLVSEGKLEGEPILSMGMSDSYRIAVEEGSTLVRVGRRLFEK